jgi:hypothetical protein
LRKYGRLLPRVPHPTEPLERPSPLTAWQLDFKDASTVPSDPDGKRQQVVEVLTTVDTGTSILLDAQVRGHFVTETVLEAVAQLVQQQGLPRQVTFDRATRFVGSASARDVPSAFMGCWRCLGVPVDVCLPHHPHQHGFVERYHRTFKAACFPVYQPQTEDQVRTITTHFQRFSTEERPHQGLSGRNQPPRTAVPVLPTVRAVPPDVDPDGWLSALHGRSYTRRVHAHGIVTVADTPSSIRKPLRGQDVRIEVDAEAREFVGSHHNQVIKQLPITGLVGQRLAFTPWIEHLLAKARRDGRRHG